MARDAPATGGLRGTALTSALGPHRRSSAGSREEANVDSIRRELRHMLRLSAPVALAQLGLMMIGVVDTLMLGRLGVTELAGAALGNAWLWTFLSFGIGLVAGIDPLISQAHGR